MNDTRSAYGRHLKLGPLDVVVHPGFLFFVAGLPLALATLMSLLVHFAAAGNPYAARWIAGITVGLGLGLLVGTATHELAHAAYAAHYGADRIPLHLDGRGARVHLPDQLQHAPRLQQIGVLLAGPSANLIPGGYLAWLTGRVLVGNVAVTGGIWMFSLTLVVLGLTQLLPWHPRCDGTRALAILRGRTPRGWTTTPGAG